MKKSILFFCFMIFLKISFAQCTNTNYNWFSPWMNTQYPGWFGNHLWHIDPSDIYLTGNFVRCNPASGDDAGRIHQTLLAICPANGWAQLMYYSNSSNSWNEYWDNSGSDNLGPWQINYLPILGIEDQFFRLYDGFIQLPGNIDFHAQFDNVLCINSSLGRCAIIGFQDPQPGGPYDNCDYGVNFYYNITENPPTPGSYDNWTMSSNDKYAVGELLNLQYLSNLFNDHDAIFVVNPQTGYALLHSFIPWGDLYGTDYEWNQWWSNNGSNTLYTTTSGEEWTFDQNDIMVVLEGYYFDGKEPGLGTSNDYLLLTEVTQIC